MHISEGILSGPVLVGGAAITAVGVAVGLRKMDYEQAPKIAVLSAAFFVASLIHLPIGPSNVHMALNGLAGIILGWTAFPALLVALLLQAILFQFGGLTTLGVNTVNMALPAVACFYLFARPLQRAKRQSVLFALGFAAGSLAIILSAALMALSLWTTGKEFTAVAVTIALAHVPVMVLEGIVTASIVVFLRKASPEILRIHTWPISQEAPINELHEIHHR